MTRRARKVLQWRSCPCRSCRMLLGLPSRSKQSFHRTRRGFMAPGWPYLIGDNTKYGARAQPAWSKPEPDPWTTAEPAQHHSNSRPSVQCVQPFLTAHASRGEPHSRSKTAAFCCCGSNMSYLHGSQEQQEQLYRLML